MDANVPRTPPRKSATFDDHTLAEIRRAATTGIYDIRGAGTKRKLPHFDDLLFLGDSISRYPLEGYREKCVTDVVLDTTGTLTDGRPGLAHLDLLGAAARGSRSFSTILLPICWGFTGSTRPR